MKSADVFETISCQGPRDVAFKLLQVYKARTKNNVIFR